MHLTRRDFLVRLTFIPGVGRKTILKIWRWLVAQQVTTVTPPVVTDLLTALPLGNQAPQIRFGWQQAQVLERESLNLQYTPYVTLEDPEYPPLLREIYEPPVVLYYLGNPRLLQAVGLGVVGTRHPSGYAVRAMRQVLPAVVAHPEICLISGMAQGVDTLGHQVALAHHGSTIAVLGTGLGRCYPASNRELMRTLTHSQLVISEYPWATGPAKFQFVERNRLIPGLSQSVLVVEAARRSGSLITANFALQENRNVLAIPGPIDAPNSVGTNELILAGAKPILYSEHIMEELLVDKRPSLEIL
ncbi:DNA-processing protein DprA [Levilactobacillus spicheri]